MISLKNRLILTYAVFISLALGVLTIVVNQFTGIIFTTLVKDNIADKSREIVKAIGEQYNPNSRSFDSVTVEAMGMYFVHEGYIITVEDEQGYIVWDARSCDMQQCTEVINGIASRMNRTFRLKGEMQKQQYPIQYIGRTIGNVIIETYGPFFFSETESKFLASINKVLLVSSVAFIMLTIAVSLPLARAIAKPILKAGEAARQIAKLHAGGNNYQNIKVRLLDTYKTRELAELSHSINTLAEELEEGERRQKQLSLDIAHELRTPLTCLQGSIEAMLDGVWEADKNHLISCHEEVLRLSRLVQDLNTLTNLEWENISLNKTGFDLSTLLYNTIEQFKPAAHEKGIAINLNLKVSPINADYDRLKQVFINLLSNAIKYTDKGSISVAIEKGTKNWRVSIADTGIGINAADLPHIFERLYRSDKSRNRGTGGAGIGLAIAAAIIAAHEGIIRAESPVEGRTGTGSVFHVEL